MWYGVRLQRSYKYMFASKMPTLRIGHSDLKCKNGCDYYGNPQWQGYCSKCHREQMHRQRKAEKITSSTLPKPDQKKQEQSIKLASHSSFSKFEEKRLRQSETLKKANILKFNVFKKSNTAADEQDQTNIKKVPEFKIPSSVNEQMKRDLRTRLPSINSLADRDCRAFVHSLIKDVIKCAPDMSVDELSERVQRQYQRFLKHMDNSSLFSNVDSETKEILIDLVEKHAMSFLHDLPSMVFSPNGTDDERADRAMSERIQQLSWVGESHLDCKLDRNDKACSKLLYKAICELLGMDSVRWPGGKAECARRCCSHVVALCAAASRAPPSADDLLPALIFTILKANPPRLISNINFVTRFCHAPRLMTGEAGYYFTNLCCAVSFIENLTAESLSMDKKEFDCYMAMPASIGGSSWAAALSLCAELSEAEEQRALALKLLNGAEEISRRADELAENAISFEEEISKKVQNVLNKTPLEVKPRHEIPHLSQIKDFHKLIDLNANDEQSENHINEKNLLNNDIQANSENIIENVQNVSRNNPEISILPTNNDLKENDNFDELFKTSNSLELLTPSPLGFKPFDDLISPDEYNPDNIVPGLSAINYDIDLSDLSGENSMAEEKSFNPDPFSPEGVKNDFWPSQSKAEDTFDAISDAFNQFSLADVNAKDKQDPFSIIPPANMFAEASNSNRNIEPTSNLSSTNAARDFNTAAYPQTLQRVDQNEAAGVDPFSPLANKPLNFEQFEDNFDVKTSSVPFNNTDPFSPLIKKEVKDNASNSADGPVSLLDNDSSPNTLMLPAPLKPQSNNT